MTGVFKYRQYHVVGRHLPTEKEANPPLYRRAGGGEAQTRCHAVVGPPTPLPRLRPCPASFDPGTRARAPGARLVAQCRRRLRSRARSPLPVLSTFRMKIWATDAVRARSKFWYFLRKLCRVKKANGQVIACNEARDPHRGGPLCVDLGGRPADPRRSLCANPQIFEKNPSLIKNYGIWIRYQSRTGYHNAYKEYRDTTMNGAVEQLYQEMASRHRVRANCIQIIRTGEGPRCLPSQPDVCVCLRA